MASNPEIAEHLSQLDDAVSRAETLLQGLDDETLNWRAAPEQWSVAQCLDHLNITAQKYVGTMQAVVEQAAKDGPHGTTPGKRRLLPRLFIWILEPPSRLRAKVPPDFRPADRHALSELREAHAQCHAEVRRLMETADGVSLDQVKALSPVSDKIRFRIGEAFAVILAHERRHLLQAEKVRSQIKTG